VPPLLASQMRNQWLPNDREADVTMPIGHEIFIEAPVDVVWRAITEPDQIVQWFSDEADVELEDGYAGALTFTERGTKGPTVAQITVQAYDPDRSFSYRWAYEPGVVPGEGNSVLVEFVLIAENGGTRLRVAESGVDQLGWSQEQKDDYVADHNRGWAQHIGDLRDYAAKQPA
jgi:uncharacterized protein YndB with AHSA1/START domain